MKQRPNKLALLAVLVASAFAGATQAAEITVGSGTSNGNMGAGTNPVAIPVNVTGDGTTVGVQLRVLYDTTNINVAVAPAGNCSVNDATGVVTIIFSDAGNQPLPATPTNICNLTATFSAMVPPSTIALDAQNTGPGEGCIDAAAAPVATCNVTDGAITIAATDTPPTITYAPAPDADGTSDGTAEVTFPAGGIGSTQTASITPTAAGGAAVASTAIACTASAGFTVTSGGAQTFPAPGAGAGAPIVVSTTLAVAAQTGVLTCVETDTPGGATRTVIWDLAAAGGVPSPEYDSALSLGLQGLPGTTANGSLAIRNLGDSPLTVSCTTASAGFTVGAVTSPIAAGATGSAAVSCTVPATAGTSIAGTLTCTTNDTSEPSVTIALTCSAISASIPTIGGAAKALLAMLMLGLGLAAFQLYRRA